MLPEFLPEFLPEILPERCRNVAGILAGDLAGIFVGDMHAEHADFLVFDSCEASGDGGMGRGATVGVCVAADIAGTLPESQWARVAQ